MVNFSLVGVVKISLAPKKIQVHAFYCVLSLLLTSLLQRELARKGESLSINRMLEELGGIRETLIVYPRSQGQRKAPTATCLTRKNALQQRLFSLLDLKRFSPVAQWVIPATPCKSFY